MKPFVVAALASLLSAAPVTPAPWAPAHPQLLTRWASLVSPERSHPEHPRPDAHREGEDQPPSWLSLNGLWDADSSPEDLSSPPFSPAAMPQRILVPYPFEAALSGIRELPKHGYMWYRRNVTLPAGRRSHSRDAGADAAAGPGAGSWGSGYSGRVLLKFEAVDWQSTLYIDGVRVGNHSGGYDSFSFDVSEHLKAKGNELLLFVFDPSVR